MADDSKLRTQRSDAHRADAGFAERPDQATSKDPLAELARLIGQDDLFEQMRKDAARAGGAPAAATARHAEPSLAAEPRAPALDAYHDLRGSFDPDPVAPMPAEEPVRRAASYRAAARQPVPAAEERYEESYQQEAHQEPSHDPAYAYPPHDDRSYSDPHAQSAHAGYADPAYDPAYPYDEQAYAEEPPPPERRRGGMMMVAAVLGLAVVGTAGAFAYRAISGPGGSEPPVIQASGAPKKVAPSPQAREQANRSFDRSGGTQPERMVSREEQPVELRESRGTPARMLGSGSPAITGTVGPAAQGAAPMMAAAGSQGIAAPAGEAKKVKTIPIRPEGAAPAQNSGRTPPAARGAPQTAAGAPVAASGQATRTASVQPSAAAPAVAGSGHVVQVASQKTEEDAQASFRALQAKYPTVLGGRQPLIRRIDLGERGVFYRVQVGPFASADQANDLCGNLKSAGGQCIVQRN